jgi:two-component system, OmpR family, sensor histidine kinase KdpD
MSEQRPDPDVLLAEVKALQAKAARGRLRVYFGASAGVGKTFAMLGAARKLKNEGREVIVGLIETHGRAETAELLEGLELLPRKRLAHRGGTIEEFDLDAALARHPSLILVDEFAHSNVPGSRHPKRWQDVVELLDAGIDVFTSLNVQHLESLNDVIGGITGIRVQETVPDTVFDAADEVVLIDIPADELLRRLKSGRVYLAEHVEGAAKNFFRKGNLMALRELALRRTADRVEGEVLAYRDEQDIGRVWKTDAALLACIGPRTGAEHVVRSAARLAGELGTAWHAVYVETPELQRLSKPERERILKCLKLAEDLGAKTAVLSGGNIAPVLAEYAREHNFSRLVIGRTAPSRWPQFLPYASSMSQRVAAHGLDIDFIEVGVSTEGAARRPAPRADDGRAAQLSGKSVRKYALAALACAATTLAATPLAGIFDLANIVMLFLLNIVFVAVRLGRGPAVFASIFGVLLFDFFFVQPRFSFAVSDVQYLVTFAVMLVVGLVIGQLTANLRYQARIASHRERRARSLYEFARDLSAALQVEQVVSIATVGLEPTFRSHVAVLLPDADDRLKLASAASFSGLDAGIAQWAYDHGEAAGFATDTLPSNPFRYLPLRAPMRVRGVLAIRPEDQRWLFVPEQQRQLDTFAALIAIALERIHYVEVARDALVNIESERLRNSLLSALSHDLRTPLTALIGLADTLALDRARLTPHQLETAEALREEARRLATLVENLLDMARLQSGKVKLKLEWQPVEEVIGAALASVRGALGSRQVKVELAPDLPLVEFDAVLIERVIANLVENAAKYAPGESPIEIRGSLEEGGLALTVADRGPGLPSGMEEAIFEKFIRGERESATTGVGLGLAICRAIVEAHHGKIRAQNRPEGGAIFTFTLPLGSPPALDAPALVNG